LPIGLKGIATVDIVFWIILIVVAAGIAWWLLKRNSATRPDGGTAGTDNPRTDGALSSGGAAASADAAATTGIPSAAGFGRPAEPAAPATSDEPADTAAPPNTGAAHHAGTGNSAASGSQSPAQEPADAASVPESTEDSRRQDQAEWETQWSEESGAAPVHHPEYTDPHAPTLPGAESAAAEQADDDGAAAAGAPQHSEPAGSAQDAVPGTVVPPEAAAAETLDRARSSAVVEAGADHPQHEATGHLAVNEPYGSGSAAAGPDGSGPTDYGVKGDAGAMVYYEEGHPEFAEARADVWFESAAHAEAAGFRAPRRQRL
jgi:hypothetical protein